MANPFLVEPANLLPGMQTLIQGLDTGMARKQKDDKLQEGTAILNKGSVEDIQQWMLKNPEYAKTMGAAFDMGNTVADERLIEAALQMYENPEQASVFMSNAIVNSMKNNVDASGLIRLAENMQGQTPEQIKKGAALTLMHKAPDAWKRIAEYEGEGIQQPGPETTEDRYVKDKMVVFETQNPNATPADKAKARTEYRLEHKRAQAPEVAATTSAKEQAQLDYAKPKAYRTEMGKRMAEIETATEVIHAGGELTPQEKKNQAKQGVTNKLATLAGYYTELDHIGGIVNVEKPTLNNIWAGIQSSGLGQFVGKTMGTDAQSLRNSIKSMKPQLINDIRQATEMGARGLDSEKELEFYLQAVTDESRDIQANVAAMIVLDEAYGDGLIASELRKLNVSPEYIKELEDQGKLILNGALLSDTERVARIKAGRTRYEAKQPARQPTQTQALPPGVTEEDVIYTMQKHNLTREQVLQKMGGQ